MLRKLLKIFYFLQGKLKNFEKRFEGAIGIVFFNIDINIILIILLNIESALYSHKFFWGLYFNFYLICRGIL